MLLTIIRGGSRIAPSSKMELFVIMVNGFQPLTIITKCSILEVVVVLDPPLNIVILSWDDYLKIEETKTTLTLSWRRPLSYRNQSIDLLCKAMDWFLYDNGLRHERVNVCTHDILTMRYTELEKTYCQIMHAVNSFYKKVFLAPLQLILLINLYKLWSVWILNYLGFVCFCCNIYTY